MGMDIYGKNPKQNRAVDKFPVMKKYDAMEFSKKWKELDKMKSSELNTGKRKLTMKKQTVDIISETTVGGGDHCGTIAIQLQMT